MNREVCPSCHTDLTDRPIPKRYREHYGDQKHFTKLLSIIDRDSDRLVCWRCPFCSYQSQSREAFMAK